MRHIGEVIAARRLASGRTRNELATAAGVDAAYLMRVERGAVVNPSWTTIRAVAMALGVSLDELSREQDEKEFRKKAKKSG